MRVLAETTYPASVAASRVRLVSFAPYLAQHGVDLHFRANLTDAEYRAIVQSGPGYRKLTALTRAVARLASTDHGDGDLRLVHRLRFLAPLPGFEPARHVDVYDFDDALFLGSISATNRRLSRLKREAARWTSYVRRAGLVIAGNDYLAERAREEARWVEVVPSCVAPESQPIRRHQDAEPLTVGWIGSPSTSAYLESVLPVLQRFHESGRTLRLLLIGADRAISAPWVEHREWRLESEARDLVDFDVGIMPLPNDEWARGKCGYKLLQYFSAGVPAIASPVGVNARLIGDDRGFLASSEEEWLRALDALADPEVRGEMGARGRRFVTDNFSYTRWAPELAAMLQSVADGHSP